ncbi:CPBP family intramembrane glutamic endopeptidase [Frateuria defendens]|uniref:CPBP family intramembrane glutamic endopeptidase n=1 Tax=Frateuria defendens TaxID=2219559 RepID=UPI00066FB882|nr:type II CAAX endopeptidase family protein [Frateuria defendens]
MQQPIVTPPPLPRYPGIGSALGMIVLYFLLQLTVGGLLVFVLHRLAGLRGPDARALLVILTIPAVGGITLWSIRRLWPLPWTQAAPPGFGLNRLAPPAFYALAVLLGLTLSLLGGWITQWLAHGHEVPQDIKQLGNTVSPAVRIPLALLAATVAPLIEELLFRGLLLSALLQRFGAGWAVAISSLLFATVHLPDLGFLWYAVPNLTLLAVALAWLRLRSGSLWPAVLAHGVNNLLAVAAWFVVAAPGK